MEELGKLDVSLEWDQNFWVLVRSQTIVLVDDEMLHTHVFMRRGYLKNGMGIKVYVAEIFSCLVVCTVRFWARVWIKLDGEI